MRLFKSGTKRKTETESKCPQNSRNDTSPDSLCEDEQKLSKMFKSTLNLPSNDRRFHEQVFGSYGVFRVPTRYVFMQINDQEGAVAGGQGAVIKAHDRVTHKDVAIKRIKNPFGQDHIARRMHREFVLSQMVKHQNVVELISIFTPQESLKDFSDVYFVLEFAKYPLGYLIKRRDVFRTSPEGGIRIAHIIRQILLGVQHLHRAGIVHRDLSVNNILVNDKFEVKIIDLGLARELPEDTKNIPQLSGYVTTRFYRAPEVALNVKYDKKVDVWSIGCIFAEILLGFPLFPGEHLEQWKKITEIMGTPSKDFLDRLSDDVRYFVANQPRHEPKDLKMILPDEIFPPPSAPKIMPCTTGPSGRDLISKMLVIDPYYRISVENALKHPFVLWPDVVDCSPAPLGRYSSTADDMILAENEWKTLIYGQLKQYERDHDIHGNMDQRIAQSCPTCREVKCGCAICNRLHLELLK